MLFRSPGGQDCRRLGDLKDGSGVRKINTPCGVAEVCSGLRLLRFHLATPKGPRYPSARKGCQRLTRVGGPVSFTRAVYGQIVWMIVIFEGALLGLAMGLGWWGVPLILIGNEKFMGWNQFVVAQALARLKDSTVTQPDPVAVQRTYDIRREEWQTERKKERPAEKYIIHLRNGRKIEVKDYWEKGDKIQYRKYGGTIGVDRKHVVMIESQVNGTKKRYSPVFTKQ